jgi:hypothetical protein
MKTTFRALVILAAVAGSVALRAEDVKWDDLCQEARSRELSLTTLDGQKSNGTCYKADATAISLKSNHGLQTVDRERITTARLDNLSRSHCIEGAVSVMFFGPFLYTQGGIVAAVLWTPFSLGAGAAASPFCAVYDLINRSTGSRKITII